MTVGRLVYELDTFGGKGEIALQIAHDERQATDRAERAERVRRMAASADRSQFVERMTGR